MNGTYTVAGAYTTTVGDQPFSFTFTVNNSAVAVPPATCTTLICGAGNGQTVSGIIAIKPNLTLNSTIRKISYYINGVLYSREYTTPFTMGGATGFDTRTLADGTHTIGGAYTTSTGDVAFSLTIVVNN